jgi:predicted oxidoreductase
MLNSSTKAQNVCFLRKKRSGSRNARHVRYAPNEGMNKTPSKCEEQVSEWNKIQKVKKAEKQICKGRKFWVYGEGIRHYDVVV